MIRYQAATYVHSRCRRHYVCYQQSVRFLANSLNAESLTGQIRQGCGLTERHITNYVQTMLQPDLEVLCESQLNNHAA